MSENKFPAEAVNVVAKKAHDPVFFDKLASDWNIEARNDSEREQLLELATTLRHNYDENSVKQASAGNPFLAGAIDSLNAVLGQNPNHANMDSAIKSASIEAVKDPELQKAVLEYGAYLASVNE